jgi:hypothetical protein
MEQNQLLSLTEQFRPEANYVNPPYCNSNMVEQMYFQRYSHKPLNSERLYLPIYWTNMYVHGGSRASEQLQRFLDQLPRDQQYYTVIQYDDGILENTEGLDIMIFSAGHPVGIPIPLLPSHMPVAKRKQDKVHRVYGCLNDTHHLRTMAKQKLAANPAMVWDNNVAPMEYLKRTETYSHTLAPRGYGVTSFRMYEAILLGAVPIYLSDVFWLPYKEYISYVDGPVILWDKSDMDNCEHLLSALPNSYNYRKEKLNDLANLCTPDSPFKSP